MSSPSIGEKLTCPGCDHVIRTTKTVGAEGRKPLTCPKCNVVGLLEKWRIASLRSGFVDANAAVPPPLPRDAADDRFVPGEVQISGDDVREVAFDRKDSHGQNLRTKKSGYVAIVWSKLSRAVLWGLLCFFSWTGFWSITELVLYESMDLLKYDVDRLILLVPIWWQKLIGSAICGFIVLRGLEASKIHPPEPQS